MKARSATSSAPICKHGSFSDASRSLARPSPDPASGLSVSSSYENLSSPNNLHLPAAYPAPLMRKHLQDVPVHSRTTSSRFPARTPPMNTSSSASFTVFQHLRPLRPSLPQQLHNLRPPRLFDPHFFREGRWAAAPMHHPEQPALPALPEHLICLPLTSGLVVRYSGCPTTPCSVYFGENLLRLPIHSCAVCVRHERFRRD